LPNRARNFTALAAFLGVVAACAFFVVAYTTTPAALSSTRLRDAAVLAILAIIAEEMSVYMRDRVTVAATGLVLVISIMFVGMLPAMVIALVVGLWGAWREDSRGVVVYNCANLSLSTLLASVVFEASLSALKASPQHVSLGLLVAGALAAVVFEGSNDGLTSVAAYVKYGVPIGDFWRQEMSVFLQSLAVLAGLGLTIAALYAEAGIVAVVLLFIPLFASQYMFKLLVREKEHLTRQKDLTDKYLEMNLGLAAAMVVLLDSKDEYTANHSAAVAMYCRDMALAAGMSEEQAEEIHLAGLLHDLGKVGTPDAILRKDTSLDADEWDYIHQHPEKGAEVLSHLAAYQNVADIVRYHHERLDGSGYPQGLAAPDIPEASKILAVADTYHAMTSDRPYRGALSSFEALKELRAMSGTVLDSRYIEVLAIILRDKDLAYRDGTATDFMDEYQRGRLSLRLRGEPFADVSGTSRVREDPAAG
jgi:putative nucleotidyltransferase with HDIG domain